MNKAVSPHQQELDQWKESIMRQLGANIYECVTKLIEAETESLTFDNRTEVEVCILGKVQIITQNILDSISDCFKEKLQQPSTKFNYDDDDETKHIKVPEIG